MPSATLFHHFLHSISFYFQFLNLKLAFFGNFWWVVSTHLKNMSQIANLPQVGVKIKKTPPSFFLLEIQCFFLPCDSDL